MSLRHIFTSVLLAELFAGTIVRAQPPAASAAAPPDTPEVTRHVDAARTSAGTDWIEAQEFLCAAKLRGGGGTERAVEPTKIFDNLYALGSTGTGAADTIYALTTSDGIILIDSGWSDQVETVLLPGMKKVGLDPATVKYVVLTHGHADHFGGALYFQQHGAHIVLSAADWDFMLQPPPTRSGGTAGRGPTPAWQLAQPPARDIVSIEGQPIVLGDGSVTLVDIPGHTPGSLGVIIPVREGRQTHVAALFGGLILTPGTNSDEVLQQYIRSIAHFGDVTRRMNVDVEIQNHTIFDGFEAKLERLKNRKQGEPNPFVVGSQGYQRFLTVMSECTQAQLERRKISK